MNQIEDVWSHGNPQDEGLMVSLEKRNKRVSICKTCESLNTFKICSECHCFMPAKTWLTMAHCPKEKW